MRQICVDRYLYARCVAGLVLLTTTAFAQKDPGPRPDPPAAGGPFSGLTSDPNFPNLMAVFQAGSDQFQQVEMVSDGLGPRFNSNSCASCHAQPAVGGTSPGLGGIETIPESRRARAPSSPHPLSWVVRAGTLYPNTGCRWSQWYRTTRQCCRMPDAGGRAPDHRHLCP
jgi:hypothetical protein